MTAGTGTMQAARWHGRRDIRVETVPVPEPDAHEVLVQVLWCGICGSDLEEYRNGPITLPVGEPHIASDKVAPITLGHEVVGVVARAAEDGSGPPVGTVVIADVVVGCGACWWCEAGQWGLCPRLMVRGQHTDGGLAEYMLADGRTCLSVPEDMPLDVAALAEPTAVATRAVAKVEAVGGARAVVVGGGTIGQLIAQVLRAGGASSVIVSDPVPARRELAAQLAGATVCSPQGLAAEVAALPEPGADVVFECTGRPGLLAESLRIVRGGGTVVAVGIPAVAESVLATDLVLSEKRLLGTAAHMWNTDVASALAMLADGRVIAAPLVTHRIPIDELVDVGLAALETDPAGTVKVLVHPTATEPTRTGLIATRGAA